MSIWSDKKIYSLNQLLLVLLVVCQLILGVKTYSDFNSMHEAWSTTVSITREKEVLLNKLEADLGFGGFIHHFKNYLFRTEDRYRQLALNDLEQAQVRLSEYKKRNLNNQEEKAIKNLELSFAEYKTLIKKAQRLIQLGKNSYQISLVIKVDESIAIESITLLNEELDKLMTTTEAEFDAGVANAESISFIGLIYVLFFVAVSVFLLKKHRDMLLEHKIRAQYLDTLKQSLPCGLVVTDDKGNIIASNKKACSLFEFEAKQLQTTNILKLLPTPEDFNDFKIRSAHNDLRFSIPSRTDSNSQKQLLLHMQRVDLQNSIRHIITISDITEVSQLQVDLAYTNGQLSQKLAELNVFNTLLNEHALVSEVDVSGIITSVNDKFCKVSGYSRDDLVGTNHNIINSGIHTTEFWQSFWADITAGKVWHGELTNRRKNGDLYWAYSTIMPFLDQKGNVYKFISACTDITKIKNAERKIHQLAYTDTLTKLPNLASFQKSLDNLMLEVRNHESEEKLTICHININDLKEINGTFGWHFGDTLIRLAAIRIQEQLQDAQLIAKVGGNHFGILRKTEHATTEECSQYLNQRLEDIFSLPFDVSGKQMKLSYSSSTVIYPSDLAEFNPHETTADEIQSYLELCRVEIEKSRNNRSIRFDKSILENVSRRTTILHTIEAALENSEVYMVYQPQICLKTNRVIGVEALMRWQKATGEFVSPGDFIPVLEVSDFINALSTWANRVCFNDLLTIQSIIPNCSLAINISAHFLTSPILLNSLQESLNEFNLNPYDIELEVTESGIIEDIDLALSQLRQVKELGFRVSIDDFGTGYSSLAYLVRFPVDQLKIDKSFIRYITLNPQSLSVTKTVISLGKSLNLNVIAEGVETSDQMALLKNEGCDSAQGYYLARPMKLEDLISWYENSEYQT